MSRTLTVEGDAPVERLVAAVDDAGYEAASRRESPTA
jgi:copper chaperone CopZ